MEVNNLLHIFRKKDTDFKLKEIDFHEGQRLVDIINNNGIRRASLVEVAKSVETQWVTKIANVENQGVISDRENLPFTSVQIGEIQVKTHGVWHTNKYFPDNSPYKTWVNKYVEKTYHGGDKWLVEQNFDLLFDLLKFAGSLREQDNLKDIFNNVSLFENNRLRGTASKSFLIFRRPELYNRLSVFTKKLDLEPQAYIDYVNTWNAISLPEPLGMELDMVLSGSNDLKQPNLIVDRTNAIANLTLKKLDKFKKVDSWNMGSLHLLIGQGHVNGVNFLLKSNKDKETYDVRRSLIEAQESLN